MFLVCGEKEKFKIVLNLHSHRVRRRHKDIKYIQVRDVYLNSFLVQNILFFVLFFSYLPFSFLREKMSLERIIIISFEKRKKLLIQ